MTRKKLEEHSIKESAAFQTISSLNDSIFQSIQNAEALPKKKVQMCCKIITACLQETNIHSWLEIVKEHHSYTYRHSMNVTGLAVAFAMHYGMRKSDINRIATGALMHDIGKARIPLSILDKPGPLTPEEIVQVRQHPVYSGIILSEDRQFDPEIIDIAVHHHEHLDGTGYPDCLKGDEISDLVRIITIVDIFSGLIDQRSYKEALPKDQAFQIMLSMKNKLDMDLLQAFKPITQNKQRLNTDAFPLQVA
jgi:putative nucleotidyltransferase with HDIG domain